MTRAEQQTERTLVEAEHNWLVTRGWRRVRVDVNQFGRYRYDHATLRRYNAQDVPSREAIALTLADPLMYTANVRQA